MALLKMRRRFKAIKTLNSILSAMQVVTSVRMQKARQKKAALGNYLYPMKDVLIGRVGTRSFSKKILVVLTASRGLCGNFNAQLFARVKQLSGFSAVTFNVEQVDFQKACSSLSDLLDRGSEMHVAYNAYKGTLRLTPTVCKIYPIPEELEIRQAPAEAIVEPGPSELVETMLQHYIEVKFYELLLNSQLGELAARLMVLKTAVENSKDLIDELTISINKLRQSLITGDLLEIISSAETMRRDTDE